MWLYFSLVSSIIWLLFASSAVGWLPLPTISSKYTFKNVTAYVITVQDHDKRVPAVIDLFRKYAHLDLQPYYGIDGNKIFVSSINETLTPGEQGLRITMKNFFTMASDRKYEQVLLFEDDAIPHRNFSYLFDHLPKRCSEADVLLLGATIWTWQFESSVEKTCFDADKFTFGAFALLVKSSAFQSIVRWLEKGPPVPADLVYAELQRNGLIVRVAYPPFLVIPDVSHASIVDDNRSSSQHNMTSEAAIHRWDLKSYPIISYEVVVK